MRRLILTAAAFALLAAPLAAQGGDRFNDVIVRLDDGASPGTFAGNRAAAAQVANDFALEARHTYGAVFSGFAARVPEERLDALRNDPRVASVSYDGIAWASQPCFVDNSCDDDDDGGDDGQTLPWGVDRVGGDEASGTGSGVHAYIIDTGIDSDHGDLADHLGNGFAAVDCGSGGGGGPPGGGGGGDCTETWDDDNGHGTHVAGTVGAIDNDVDVVGVAPEVTLHAVKVLDGGGSGSFSDIIAGIDFVAEETRALGAPTVANMSLGGGGSKDGECTSSGFTGDDNFHAAICNATNDGVVFVVAAGNDGADAEGTIPAAFDDAVITVSATEEGDDWPSFSNWGDNSASWTGNDSAPVAIAAPGVDVLSTWNDGGTDTISGTSMASPHAAGGAALFLASSNEAADYSAFTNTRASLLSTAESTDNFSNTSGDPHDEDFLDVRSY